MAFSFILDFWNKWNIRGFVVLSLSLQVTLILFASLRKKTANRRIIFLLWLAYLMADSVAAFAVGLISHNQGNSNARVAEVDGALQAFWASLLLLHLGGPDTITIFSLEDSSLWQPQLLNLILQVGAAIYVFVQIFPSNKLLVIPTILVFLAGVLKISERIQALHLSSLPKLRKSIFLHNEQSMSTNSELLELNVRGDGYGEDRARFSESIVVKCAYSFFQIFRIFISDLTYTKRQRQLSSDYFNKVSAMDALRVILVELNFIYEELHTKALTMHHKWSYIFRIIAFTSIVVALGLFNHLKNNQLSKLDVKITHILLFGELILDGIALFKLVFSDWTVAKIKHTTTGSSKLDSFLYKFVSTTDYLREPRYITCEVEANTNVTYEVLDTPLIFRRWSESISACNILSEALKESPRKICKCNPSWGIVVLKNIYSFPFGMAEKIISHFFQAGETIASCCGKRSIIANANYVSKNLFMKKLWIFVFNGVKRKSQNSDEQEMATWLVKSNQFLLNRTLSDLNGISANISKANFHNLIIIWHIATEIWYNKDEKSKSVTSTLDPALFDRMIFSKILSDYMLYLLFKQPNLISTVAMVGIAQMVLGMMLCELRPFIGDATKDLNGICEKLYNGVQDEGPLRDPTNSLESPIARGLLLAHQLEDLGERKWDVMSDMWLEFLQYAAINTKGEAHAQVLSKGGELLTFVWLLMAHLGCFYKPEWGMYLEFWDERSVINKRDDRDAECGQ